MTLLIAILRLGPMALAACLQLFTAWYAHGEAERANASQPLATVSSGLYAASGLASALAFVSAIAGWGRTPSITLAIVAGALIMAGPLVYGASIHTFTPSHHLVRLAIVAVIVGLFCWHVASHR